MKKQIVTLYIALLFSSLLAGCAKQETRAEPVYIGPNWQAVHTLQPSGSTFRVDAIGPSRVRLGETLSFAVTTEKSGRLWVVHVDANDSVTLLYPGNNSPSNWLNAGEAVTIPASGSGQVIRAVEPRGPSAVAFIVTDPDTDLYQVLTGDNPSINKALRMAQNSSPSWAIRHLVVEVE